jgi:SAM-dependent methyltransferase
MGKTGSAQLQVQSKLGLKAFHWRTRATHAYYMYLRSGRSFNFQGKTLPYLEKGHNFPWRNERTVEIPIFQHLIAAYDPTQLLEVGNVLGCYGPVSHTIVDKYEKGTGVQNIDIVDYAPGRAFDLIISISTLEHVGWDEAPRDPAKVRRAIDHLRSLLTPTGRLVVSLPVGYNSEVDALLEQRSVPWSSLVCLKRARWDNTWREVPWSQIADARYNNRTPTATAIIIGTVGTSA